MSQQRRRRRKKGKGLPERTPEERLALLRRRVVLAVYLLFLACSLVGSQATWWQLYVGAKPLGDPMTGPEFLRTAPAAPGGPDEAESAQEVERRVNVLRPSVIAALACLVAFFFASYDLVADADIQMPVFVATLVVCCVGGYVFYDVWMQQSVIREAVLAIEESRILGGAHGADVAPVASGDAAPPAPEVRLQLAWGLALLLSASLVMFLSSLYLTFFARRAEETT